MVNNAVLTSFLKPKPYSLARYGRDNDGGYLIVENDIEKSEYILCLGINDDWSFERDIYEKYGVSIHCFDGSISLIPLIKLVIKNAFHFPNLKPFTNSLKSLITFKKFFSQAGVHFKKMYVGRAIGCTSITFSKSVQICDIHKPFFLKVDIEGSEYRILDEILGHKNLIQGLAIEFHDFDLHIAEIQRFTERLGLQVAHVHVNNYGEVDDENIPIFLEVVYSSSTPNNFNKRALLPNSLDMPNDPARPEVQIVFSNAKIQGEDQ